MAYRSEVARDQPVGVLLAAGRGRRMGGRKQFHLVPTAEGEKPLVAAAFDSIASECQSMIVVVGHRAKEVIAALGDREFSSVTADADAAMFDSVKVGLRAAQAIDAGVDVLLQLGDHPQVLPETLQHILTAASANSTRAVMPEYQGQGGHPVFLPVSLIQNLLDADCPDGLREFWNNHPESCFRVAVEDAAVVRDIDVIE
ncbi:nucleotidyltransferase family protein [Bythopirellula polymerisocia]|uniref:Molybdopterin-guanine dinucleotide biosynthesis protein MobA n=1 Tax=Bythopirellula polymerisocia TaxID=2528003 RepID=A0A5C6CHG9_9BACT|nr:NTP transferase domain-containing protein [Bythopirellula polymerisocia]TWU22666.1 molybdopterin-guanine dinucleotide biosynthesis protein MobA [Bythopirellula polymerisocia]